MTAIYVIRHPQTTWNVSKRYQGRLEAPLSGEGMEQCRMLAQAFATSELDAVYSSPLRRAATAAEQIARSAGAPLIVDGRLTELALGPWEGLYLEQIKSRFPDMFGQWNARPNTVRFPHGESLAEVRDRCDSVLSEVAVRHPHGHVAVVTHSAVVRVLAAGALGLDLSHFHRMAVSNASVTIICAERSPGTLFCLNDVSVRIHSPIAAAAEYDCLNTERTI